jgi:hypothetical protein
MYAARRQRCHRATRSLRQRLLAERRSHPAAVFQEGATPLRIAARSCQADAIALLADHGAVIDAADAQARARRDAAAQSVPIPG